LGSVGETLSNFWEEWVPERRAWQDRSIRERKKRCFTIVGRRREKAAKRSF